MGLPVLNRSTDGFCSSTLAACIFLVDCVSSSGSVAASCLLMLAFFEMFDLGVVRRFLISLRRFYAPGGSESYELR